MANKKERNRSKRDEFSDVQKRMTEKTHGGKKYNRNKDGYDKNQARDYKSWRDCD